jgi:putative ABC transport system ATP-binding protein
VPASARPARAGAHVVVHGLRRAHGERIVALDGVDLELRPGEFAALTGPSGSGKTTLLGLIGGLDRPTAGEVKIDGRTVTAAGADRALLHRAIVGFIFQQHNLLSHLTARDNVELPLVTTVPRRAERRRRAVELLDEVGLAERASERVVHLSGGERQRVAVARALANNPRLLLADEPTGALDSASAERVLDLSAALRSSRGMTVLMVTHDPLVATRADRVLHLRDGRLVDDPPDLGRGQQLGA